MLEATDAEYAPWHIVPSDDKRRARLNCIAHLLGLVPYEKLPRKKVQLPERSTRDA
jgi:polyphosphate kinase 2 (PPK2 family)